MTSKGFVKRLKPPLKYDLIIRMFTQGCVYGSQCPSLEVMKNKMSISEERKGQLHRENIKC